MFCTRYQLIKTQICTASYTCKARSHLKHFIRLIHNKYLLLPTHLLIIIYNKSELKSELTSELTSASYSKNTSDISHIRTSKTGQLSELIPHCSLFMLCDYLFNIYYTPSIISGNFVTC